MLPMLFPEKLVDHEYDCVINKEFKKISLGTISTKYIILIFYPLDFTFVCPTEIIKLSSLHDEISKLDATVLFVSGDSIFSHLNWIKLDKNEGGLGDVTWPMVSDITHKLSSQFNLFNEETGTVVRSTVILDNTLKTLHISANIDPIGRSSKEIIRLIKALRCNAENGNICQIDFDE